MQVGQNLQNGVNYKYLELYTNNFWKLPLFLIFIVKLYIYIYIMGNKCESSLWFCENYALHLQCPLLLYIFPDIKVLNNFID